MSMGTNEKTTALILSVGADGFQFLNEILKALIVFLPRILRMVELFFSFL